MQQDFFTGEWEPMTMLQLEAQNFTKNIRRPDILKDFMEKRINTDARFDSFINSKIKVKCNPNMIDVKVPKDELIANGNRPLETQIVDIIQAVEFQQNRILKLTTDAYNPQQVMHVINLFLVRPIDRSWVIESFYSKARRQNINLDYILFINTNPTEIYSDSTYSKVYSV